MKNKLRLYWTVIKESAIGLIEDDSMMHASSIAFYTIFSLPAVLIITLVIGATFYEQTTVRDELINQISTLVGRNNAMEVENILSNAAVDSESMFAKIVGIATLIFSATTVFASLQSGLNNVWKIKAKPERGIIKYIINRFLSMAMVVSIGFILMVSLMIDTVLAILQNHLTYLFSDFAVNFLTAINYTISLGFLTVLFALIFKVLPDAHVTWRNVWIGSMITTALFIMGKFLIGFYLGTSSLGSTYGAAGSLVLILVWVYYSTIIVLYGAEFTYVYANKTGRGIAPYKNAVHFKVVEVEAKDSKQAKEDREATETNEHDKDNQSAA